MAYYEMMPAGLPAGLQSGMDSVLNKKFGTATSYAPGTWPDTVNLMGPLPEKTIVSSPIADFSDGADDVPTKSLVVTIPPTLDGVSSLTETQTGRNLMDFSYFSDYSNWKTDITENQSYPTANANRGLLLDLPKGTYTVSFGIDAETYPTYLYLCKDDGSASTRLIYFTGANFSVSSGTFTVDGTSKYYFRLGSTGSEANFNSQIAKIAWGQIEVGSTASTFESYSGTTYTANLGRTIYGGSVDVVNGTGTEQYQKVKVSDLTWQKSTASGKDFFVANISEQENANTHDAAIDIAGLSYAGMVTVAAMSDKSLAKWLQSVRIYDTNISSVSDLLSAYGNGEIVFYLKDTLQTDFTFDGQEVPTRLGVNNFWSDSGNTEVTYRADIDLLLGGN